MMENLRQSAVDPEREEGAQGAEGADLHEPTTMNPVLGRVLGLRNLLRWLYDWVLHWAETPYGTPALFVVSFAESSFFPVPPDVLQIALSVSKPRRAFFYAAVSTVASVLGAIVGWYIGYALWATLGDVMVHVGVTQERVSYVSNLYQENAFLAIFGAAFTIIPFKVFTIAAGICQVGLPVLLVASLLGRGARFFLVAVAIFFFGEKITAVIDRYFGLVTLAAFLLVVLGFVAIKYFVH